MCFLVNYKAVAMATVDIRPHCHSHLEPCWRKRRLVIFSQSPSSTFRVLVERFESHKTLLFSIGLSFYQNVSYTQCPDSSWRWAFSRWRRHLAPSFTRIPWGPKTSAEDSSPAVTITGSKSNSPSWRMAPKAPRADSNVLVLVLPNFWAASQPCAFGVLVATWLEPRTRYFLILCYRPFWHPRSQ